MYIIHIITDASTHAYVYPKPAILFFRLNDDPWLLSSQTDELGPRTPARTIQQ